MMQHLYIAIMASAVVWASISIVVQRIEGRHRQEHLDRLLEMSAASYAERQV